MSVIELSVVYPHPPERVWRALTEPAALAAWLMPNDFAPVVGHRFTFRTDPAPGFDGIVRCEVLELAPPRRLVYSWRGGPLDTVVAWMIEPAADGARLTLRHSGFEGSVAEAVRQIMGSGWGRMSREDLPALLDQLAAAEDEESQPELTRQ